MGEEGPRWVRRGFALVVRFVVRFVDRLGLHERLEVGLEGRRRRVWNEGVGAERGLFVVFILIINIVRFHRPEHGLITDALSR